MEPKYEELHFIIRCILHHLLYGQTSGYNINDPKTIILNHWYKQFEERIEDEVKEIAG